MQTHTILVVDDNRNVRKLITDCISGKLGYSVLMGKDGKEAIHCLADERVDVVLTDIHMPGLSGFVLMTEIQKRALTRKSWW